MSITAPGAPAPAASDATAHTGEVNTEKAEATYKDGLLRLKLPEVEPSKRRRIYIK